MRIAVIGAGCSGLVTLKYLLDAFPAETIVCFEKTHSIRGVWGSQRPDFVSTSTKFTTQFSCFRRYRPEVSPEKNYEEFYRGSEFGNYLEAFAVHFGLKQYIRFGVELRHLAWGRECWSLLLSGESGEERQAFDAVFLCTGLANQRAPAGTPAIPVTDNPEGISHSTVIVVGGGESASDVANYLAKAEFHNQVYLSLRSGIRVSPRYHPIRGVPSDFLRNRLLLSFDKRVRNEVGERFVTFRIRFDQRLAKWFPHARAGTGAHPLRREWDLKLKARAKGRLFNVFHNKSDDFLNAVAENRLQIIGPAIDGSWSEYYDFERASRFQLKPDVLVFSTGYRSRLPELSGGSVHLRDFYLGCVYTGRSGLFLIGFARPIIGNIPSISEMQARYAVGLLSGKYTLPAGWQQRHRQDWDSLCAEYPAINTENVYPVEHFAYSDRLAGEMGILPTLKNAGSWKTWLKIMLTPISTFHYVDEYFDREEIDRQKVYTPALLIALMGLMRLAGLPLRWVESARRKQMTSTGG